MRGRGIRALLLALLTVVLPSQGFAVNTKQCHLQGRVTDALGLPVANAQLGASSGSGTSATVLTDQDGYYRFSNLATGSYTVTGAKSGCTFVTPSLSGVVATASLHASCGLQNSQLDFVAACQGQSLPTIEIVGRVFKRDGITGAPRVLVKATPSTGVVSRLLGVTDANGEYRIRVPAGSYTVAPALASGTTNPGQRVVTVSNQTITGVDFTLLTFLQYRNIKGTVRQAPCEGDNWDIDPSRVLRTTCASGIGIPWSDVLVTAGPGYSAVTEADGTFRLIVPDSPTELALTAVYAGTTFNPQTRFVKALGGDLTGVDIQAVKNPKGFRISGTVMTLNGPLPNATVDILGATVLVRGEPQLIAGATTDTSGNFSTDRTLPVGSYLVRVVIPSVYHSSPIYRRVEIHGGDVATNATSFYITTDLDTAHPFYGRVAFANGIPNRGASVSPRSGSTGVVLVTDGNGMYLSTRGYRAGDYSITIGSTGHTYSRVCGQSPCPENVSALATSPTEVNFVAACAEGYKQSYDRCVPVTTQSIRGLVRTGNGVPMADIWVTLGSQKVRTDSSGVFAFSNIVEGEYTLAAQIDAKNTVSPSRYTVFAGAEAESGFDFVVSGPGATTFSLSGQVAFSDGTGVGGVAVAGVPPGYVTNPDGTFTFSGLPNGDYTLSVLKSGYVFQHSSKNVKITNGDVTGMTFTALCAPTFVRSAGQCVPFVGAISGSVTFDDGIVAVGAPIRCGALSRTTSDSGVYRCEGLTGGNYTVSGVSGVDAPYVLTPQFENPLLLDNVDLQSRDLRARCNAGYMRSSDKKSCVPFRGKLTGAIRFSDNVGAEGIAIAAGGLSAVSRAGGGYTVENVPNGEYTVTASSSGMRLTRSFSERITVFDSDVGELNFLAECLEGHVRSNGRCVPFTGTVSGTVVFGSGDRSGVSGVRVLRGEAQATTSASGGFSFADVPNGTHTIQVAQPGYTFTLQFSNPVQVNNQSNSNLVILAECALNYMRQGAQCVPFSGIIGGTVKFSDGTPLSSVTVRRAGVEVNTDVNGAYAFQGVANGEYQLTAVRSGYTLTPKFQNPVRVANANQLGVDFVAACGVGFVKSGDQCVASLGTIAGKILWSDGQPLVDVVVSNGKTTVKTDIRGEFSFINLAMGSYVLTPTLEGVTFTQQFVSPIVFTQGGAVTASFEARCLTGLTKLNGKCVTPAGADSITLVASNGTSTEFVALEWTGLPDVLTYLVYRSSKSGVQGDLLAGNVTTTSYKDSSAQAGQIQYYTVVAVRKSGLPVTSNQGAGLRRDGSSTGPTDPGDPGTDDPTSKRRSPLFASYNTSLDQQNLLELTSAGSAPVTATVTLFSASGQPIASEELTIAAGSQVDIPLSQRGARKNTTGVVRVDFNDQSESVQLIGRVSRYRFNPGKKDYSFAYAVDLLNSFVGPSYSVANTSVRREKKGVATNWGEIINTESSVASFSVNTYSQTGALLRNERLTLTGLSSKSFQCGGKRGVSLCEVLPDDPVKKYLSFSTRYGAPGPIAKKSPKFHFALGTTGRPGATETVYAPTSNRRGKCWSEETWLEVGNVGTAPSMATVTVRDSTGALRSEVPLALAPKSTLHYPLTAALKKGDRGTVALQSSVPGALIAQSVVYYIDCKTKQSQTAYSSELRAPGEATQLGSVNTNLRMKNLLTVINTTAERVGVNAGIVLNGGARRTTAPLNATSLSASVTALSDQPFSLAPNSLGVTAVTVDRGASVVSELLRMREDKNGGMDFVVATPLR